MLGVPVLAGSCAYAISEGVAWRGFQQRQPGDAKKSYGVLAAAMLIGMAIDYAGLNAVQMSISPSSWCMATMIRSCR
jgi:hypothetical protein